MGHGVACPSTLLSLGSWGMLRVSPHARAGLLLPGLERGRFSAEVLGSCLCGLQSLSAESLPGGKGNPRRALCSPESGVCHPRSLGARRALPGARRGAGLLVQSRKARQGRGCSREGPAVIAKACLAAAQLWVRFARGSPLPPHPSLAVGAALTPLQGVPCPAPSHALAAPRTP